MTENNECTRKYCANELAQAEMDLAKNVRWFIGVIVVLAIPFMGFQWRQSMQVTEAVSSVTRIEAAMQTLTKTVGTLIADDVADMKTRLAIMEQKQILPKAEREIEAIESRLAKLESRIDKP